MVKGNKQAKQAHLIQQLNPVIRGWAAYHRHVVAKATFHRADAEIWHVLWQWAKRRHPRKSRRWIKTRYFHCVGNRHWVFAAASSDGRGHENPMRVQLAYASDTPIRRHRKIKAAANPFDPKWASYFEKRLNAKKKDNRLRWETG